MSCHNWEGVQLWIYTYYTFILTQHFKCCINVLFICRNHKVIISVSYIFKHVRTKFCIVFLIQPVLKRLPQSLFFTPKFSCQLNNHLLFYLVSKIFKYLKELVNQLNNYLFIISFNFLIYVTFLWRNKIVKINFQILIKIIPKLREWNSSNKFGNVENIFHWYVRFKQHLIFFSWRPLKDLVHLCITLKHT
jgi:hypothetical protein